MRTVALPFLVPDPDRFEASAWTLESPGLAVEGRTLPGWDLHTPLSVSLDLHVDLTGALEDCELQTTSVLGASLRWRSTKTRIRGQSMPLQLVQGTNVLTVDPDPGLLGGQLVVDVIVSVRQADAPGPLSPTMRGALLWKDTHSWTLEGEGDRFPIEVIDFRRAAIRGAGAAWVLQWSRQEPDVPASAAVRLQLNQSHPAVQSLLSAQAGDPAYDAAASVLRRDVLRELAEVALSMDDFEIDVEAWPEGSLGYALSITLSSAFPGVSIGELRSMRASYRADFESSLQDASGFLSAVNE